MPYGYVSPNLTLPTDNVIHLAQRGVAMETRKLGFALLGAIIAFVVLGCFVYGGTATVLIELYNQKCYTTDCDSVRRLMILFNENAAQIAFIGAVLVAGLVLAFFQEGIVVTKAILNAIRSAWESD